MFEVETLEAFDALVERNRDLRQAVLQALDLGDRTAALEACAVDGAAFLGCKLDERALQSVMLRGALVFPSVPDVPYRTFRACLYAPEELYAGFDPDAPQSYESCLDAVIYRHYLARGGVRPMPLVEALAQRLHDLSMSDALDGLLAGLPDRRRVVAMMGGHALPRGRGAYLSVARVARELTRRGFFMISGGGPGAMEATHLGAWFATRSEEALVEAVDLLASAPMYTHRDWLARAFEVRRRFPLESPQACRSLGIPTWHYGHEPPNPFASHIAKYFANSVREDGLVTLATGGIIFAPGSAGTIQEIFQDACQNHYKSVDGLVSPMIFFGRAYWSWEKPVFPLLAQLAAGHEYASLLRLTDDEAAIVEALEAFAANLPPLTPV